jgi:enamine deaminase RidA (YjgF/YER057c/UK114 family)
MKILNLSDLRTAEVYEEFLRIPALSVGLYRHEAGVDVPQEPHTEDEVYYVISGRGIVAINGMDHAVTSGSVVYVPSGVVHHFHTVTEPLQVLVVFAPAEGSKGASSLGTSRVMIPARTKWESEIAYSRAIRVGSFVAISQTSAVDSSGAIAGGSDPYQQAVHALQNVERALSEAGAELKDVVRTRIYVARFEDWPEVARAHAKMFGNVRPAMALLTCTMVSEEILVEFEADAIVVG